jgi:hypothetical protein
VKTRVKAATFVVLAMMCCVVACDRADKDGSGSVGQSGEVAAAVKELAARPDVVQAMKTYNAFLRRVMREFTKAHFTGEWKQHEPANSTSCAGFDGELSELNAETRYSPIWGASGISVEDWPAAFALLKKLADEAGFTAGEVMRDEPGDHVLVLHKPDGAILNFGTTKATAISITSGCHRLAGKPIDPYHP